MSARFSSLKEKLANVLAFHLQLGPEASFILWNAQNVSEHRSPTVRINCDQHFHVNFPQKVEHRQWRR